METFFDSVVLQPTSLCNLNCQYCYLGDRNKNLLMSPLVVRRVAEAILSVNRLVNLVWHLGEPLSSGIDHFRTLLSELDEVKQLGLVRHNIQTNATLIDDEWCKLFKEHRFLVGVSVDGPKWANRSRVNWSGAETHDRTMAGIAALKRAGIPFRSICVVTDLTVEIPEEIYDFFCGIGTNGLAVNFEEKEAANSKSFNSESKALDFWKRIIARWKENPVVPLRQVRRITQNMSGIVSDPNFQILGDPDILNVFPSVTYDGKVVLLSPELIGGKSELYNDFVVGNILHEPLVSILERGLSERYVQDFVEGVEQCKRSCQYFSICGGGQASNKFFEHGTVNATETVYCKNVFQYPAEALLESL